MTVDRDTFITTFLNVQYNPHYNCCVEVLYTDRTENAQACMGTSTDGNGNEPLKNVSCISSYSLVLLFQHFQVLLEV